MSITSKTIFTFASDLADEGVDHVLGNVQDRAGLDGIVMTTVYHAARDLFPHNPRRRVSYIPGGRVYFRPDRSRYRDLSIEPVVDSLVLERDVLAEACELGGDRGMQVGAFVVYLHADRYEFPKLSTVNAFGDVYVTDLCPSNPEVRAYVRAITGDLARYDIDRVFAESLNFQPIEHGFHHERYAITLDETSRYLLGLCFCVHCSREARDRGVDPVAVQREVRDRLARSFAEEGGNGPAEVTREGLSKLADGELLRYLDMRSGVVSSLVEEVVEVLETDGKRLVFLDFSGGVKGYVSGAPEGAAAADIGWQFGIDLERIQRACGEVAVVGYAAAAERLRLDLETYRTVLGEGTTVVLRPVLPDCDSSENLVEKVGLVNSLGIERVAFHSYGLMRLSGLEWIRQALENVGGTW